MALIRTVPMPFGISISYWKVAQLQINWLHRTVQVILAGYIDEPTRRAGAQPVRTIKFDFDIPPGVTSAADFVQLAYTAIKRLDEWASASDAQE